MEQSKIDFNNIASLKYSNRSQSNEENYTNENILLFGDDDIEVGKNELNNNGNYNPKRQNINQNKNINNVKIMPSQEIRNTKNIIRQNNINLKINNHFKIIEPLNIDNTQKIIFKQNSGEISPKLIGKKRKQENTINDNNKETTEQEKKIIFNDILIICQEISNLNNDIIKKEEQNSVNTDNDNIETTLIINDSPLATIYLNKDIVNKIYVFKNKKNLIKENEIISQLKQIKKNMTLILNQLKKKKTF